MCTLLQSMMLLDNRYGKYEFSSISADEIMMYASTIKNNYSEEQKEKLYDIIDYLEKSFPEKDKMLKKINIPIVMLCADTAMGRNYNGAKGIYRVGPMYFRQWFSCFFEECYEGYKEYCSSGSIKKEKTLKRIEIMEKNLREYFELAEDDAPELQEQDTDIPALESDASTKEPAGEDSPSEDRAENSNRQEDCGNTPAAEDTAPDSESDLAEKPSEDSSLDGRETA